MYSLNLLALWFICDIWGQSGASCLSWFTVNKDLSVSALQFWLTGNNKRGRVPPPLVLTALAGAQTDPPPSHLQVNRKAVQLAVPVANTARILPVSVHLPQLWKTMAVSKLSFVQLEELFERNIIVSAGFGILCLLCLPCSFQSGWRWHGWAKPAQLSSHPLAVSSSLQVMVKPIPVLHLPSWWCLTCHHQVPELVHSWVSVWSCVKQIRNTKYFYVSIVHIEKARRQKSRTEIFFFAVLICASLSGTNKLLIFTLHWCDPTLFFFLTGPLPLAGHMRDDVCWIITICWVAWCVIYCTAAKSCTQK